jgi:DNA polymerase III delta prime subunit
MHIVEPADGPDTIYETAFKAVLGERHSLLLTGPAGTGKIHLAKALVSELKEQGEQVHLISLCHVGACVLGGCTIHIFLHKLLRTGYFRKGWLVIDEAGQIGVSLWAELQQLCLEPDVRFIVMGDRNQFSPIDMVWRGTEVSATIWDSSLLQHMCGSLEIQLTRYRRGDDAELFSFYSSIPTTMATWTVDAAVSAFKEKFPLKPGSADYNLVISHARRVQINGVMNRLAFQEYNGPYIEIARPDKFKGKN